MIIDRVVNLIRYIKGERQFDNWSNEEMFYVLTKSGGFADWLHVRRQIKYREKLELNQGEKKDEK